MSSEQKGENIMHYVTIVGVGTNEVPKFDADKAEWMNPAKGKIKWDETVDITEAGVYNNCGTGKKPKAVIMSQAEYEALTSGKNLSVPETVLDRLEGFGMQLADYIKSLRTEG